MLILDFGSGNTCRNSLDYVKRMLRELAEVDPHNHEVVIKWQLFEVWGKNTPLLRQVYAEACKIARGYGYETTASIFDLSSLDFLLRMHYSSGYEVPFIKIANNIKLKYLSERIPEDIRLIRSVGDPDSFGQDCMCCVSKYPAKREQYEKVFTEEQLRQGISDHTINWDLYNKYRPEIFECHYRLADSIGLDAQAFARTPKDLMEIL